MSAQRLVETFRQQAVASARLGSPMYADLCGRSALDVEAGGPVLDVVRPRLDDLPTLTPLRLLGGVHRLVLERREPLLATFYPSVGGAAEDTDARWDAFLEVVSRNSAELTAALGSAPQTNEVGRAAPLVGALHHAMHIVGARPVRLFEAGASAGLNLWADRFRVEDRGPADSLVQLRDAWTGAEVPAADLDVVERRGCDLSPVDPTTTEGRLRLTSYVWPDDTARIERLRGALALVQGLPHVVDQVSALDWLADVRPTVGHLTVVWHSVARLYLSTAERDVFDGLIDGAGDRATAEAPFAHVSLEPRGGEDAFPVVLRTWPGGAERVLGTAPAHGMPTTWNR